jgi:hypothetical protein
MKSGLAETRPCLLKRDPYLRILIVDLFRQFGPQPGINTALKADQKCEQMPALLWLEALQLLLDVADAHGGDCNRACPVVNVAFGYAWVCDGGLQGYSWKLGQTERLRERQEAAGNGLKN